MEKQLLNVAMAVGLALVILYVLSRTRHGSALFFRLRGSAGSS